MPARKVRASGYRRWDSAATHRADLKSGRRRGDHLSFSPSQSESHRRSKSPRISSGAEGRGEEGRGRPITEDATPGTTLFYRPRPEDSRPESAFFLVPQADLFQIHFHAQPRFFRRRGKSIDDFQAAHRIVGHALELADLARQAQIS